MLACFQMIIFLQLNAQAVAAGIADYLGVTKSVTRRPSIYRVFIDDHQVGAYSDTDNLLNQVKKAVTAWKTNVRLQKA